MNIFNKQDHTLIIVDEHDIDSGNIIELDLVTIQIIANKIKFTRKSDLKITEYIFDSKRFFYLHRSVVYESYEELNESLKKELFFFIGVVITGLAFVAVITKIMGVW